MNSIDPITIGQLFFTVMSLIAIVCGYYKTAVYAMLWSISSLLFWIALSLQ